MARIASIAHGTQNVQAHSTEVDCFIQELDTPDGVHLVHISTFGSADRASAPKSSQSMQFDRERATELIEQLVAAFGRGVLPSRSAE